MLKTSIEREIGLISENVECAQILLNKITKINPDIYDILAAGSLLQTYYNGLENIFKLINKNFDFFEIQGINFHTELLMSMFAKTDKRNPVLDSSIKSELKKYLGFRHVFRHSYGYKIDWEKVKPLFEGLKNNWKIVEISFTDFCKKYL